MGQLGLHLSATRVAYLVRRVAFVNASIVLGSASVRRLELQAGHRVGPPLGVDHVLGPHAEKRRLLTPTRRTTVVRTHGLEVLLRLVHATLLRVPIAQPGRVVPRLPLGAIGTGGDDVLRDHLGPHAERQEDVGGHVLRVRCARRDPE